MKRTISYIYIYYSQKCKLSFVLNKVFDVFHLYLPPQNEATYDNVFTLQYLDMVLSETLRIHPPGSRYTIFIFLFYG